MKGHVSWVNELTIKDGAHPTAVYLSANRTCEMGLQQATG